MFSQQKMARNALFLHQQLPFGLLGVLATMPRFQDQSTRDTDGKTLEQPVEKIP